MLMKTGSYIKKRIVLLYVPEKAKGREYGYSVKTQAVKKNLRDLKHTFHCIISAQEHVQLL